jgi:hypothetical protein
MGTGDALGPHDINAARQDSDKLPQYSAGALLGDSPPNWFAILPLQQGLQRFCTIVPGPLPPTLTVDDLLMVAKLRLSEHWVESVP